MTPEEINLHVKKELPDARVAVRDMTGGGDHYEIHVVSDTFDGKDLLTRHRLMHQIFEGPMSGDVHAVKFKTLTHKEAEEKNL